MSKNKDKNETWTELFRIWEDPSLNFCGNNPYMVVSAVENNRWEYPTEILKVKVEKWVTTSRPSYKSDTTLFSHRQHKHLKDIYAKYKPPEIVLPLDDFTLLYWEIINAKIPVVGFSSYCGFDGITYGIYISKEYSTTIELEWWCDGPEEWREFTSAVNNMFDFLKLQVENYKKR